METFEKLPVDIDQIIKEGGKITLKQINKEAGAFTVCPAKDPQRPGFYLGVEKITEDDKKSRKYYVDPEKLNVKLTDGKVFDLSDEVDKINWNWIKYIPEIAMSFENAQKSSYETRFYVMIEEVESRKTVKRLEVKLTALNLVKADDPTNYSSRARLLGVDMRGSTAIAQREFLMEEADKRPERVLDVYNSDTVGIRLLVLNALDKGVVDYDQRIYSYNTTTLGMSEDAVIEFLTRSVNRPIRDLIQGDLDHITNPEKEAEEIVETVEVAEVAEVETTKSRPRGGGK